MTEQARTLAAVGSDIRPTHLRLTAAMMPETRENAQLAERDEVRVRFTFRATERAAGHLPQRREPRRAAKWEDTEQN